MSYLHIRFMDGSLEVIAMEAKKTVTRGAVLEIHSTDRNQRSMQVEHCYSLANIRDYWWSDRREY